MRTILTYKERLAMFPTYSRTKIKLEHDKVSAKALSSLARELKKKGLEVMDDTGWSYHIVLLLDDGYLSMYCGGFDKRIEIVEEGREEEVTFWAPKGAANFIEKLVKARKPV